MSLAVSVLKAVLCQKPCGSRCRAVVCPLVLEETALMELRAGYEFPVVDYIG